MLPKTTHQLGNKHVIRANRDNSHSNQHNGYSKIQPSLHVKLTHIIEERSERETAIIIRECKMKMKRPFSQLFVLHLHHFFWKGNTDLQYRLDSPTLHHSNIWSFMRIHYILYFSKDIAILFLQNHISNCSNKLVSHWLMLSII